MSTTTITREQLVSIARLSIADVWENGLKVSPALESDLMKIAQTTDKISGDWRVGDCGCLIGTHYGTAFENPEALPKVEFEIGSFFWDHLEVIVGEDNFAKVITVVEDDDLSEFDPS